MGTVSTAWEGGSIRRLSMSTVELFWQYAEQALRQAVQSKNEKEQLALIELARTWTQTAEGTTQPRSL
jgi:hypothetical protein